MACWLGGHCQSAWSMVEVRGSIPVDSINFLTNNQPIAGCHVAAHDWATWHQTTNQKMPRVETPFAHICQSETAMSSYATSMSLCHIRPLPRQHVWTVRTAQSAQFFLPVWRFEQIAISLSSDVRLNPNELRWVCDDEGYAPVRFEAILRTLIFELKFDPWSRF
jgi:hypothetical protein